MGLLPEGVPVWVWPSAFIQNPLEEGQTMAQIARAVGNLSRQTGASTPMQLLSEEECRRVLIPLLAGLLPKIKDADRFEPPAYQIDKPEPSDGKGGGSESTESATKRSEKKDDQARADQST